MLVHTNYFGMKMCSFAELRRWLAELPNQTTGMAAHVCETGEPYVEFAEFALTRPDDVTAIEEVVVMRMLRSLTEYLDSRKGRIYWRTPFESEIVEHAVVVRFDENGPDTDFLTDRKCVKDHNWRKISCYCRLYRASMETVDPRDVMPAKAA